MKILSVKKIEPKMNENEMDNSKKNKLLKFIFCPLFLIDYLQYGDIYRYTYSGFSEDRRTELRIEKETLDIVLGRVREDFHTRNIDFSIPEDNQAFIDKIFRMRDTSNYYENDLS